MKGFTHQPRLNVEAKYLPHPGTGCWNWLAGLSEKGYAMSRGVGGRVHIFLYRMYRGEIALGLELDHLCRNRRCVNPYHLEAVTHAENVRRGNGNHRKTHCPHGHEYDAENTFVSKRGTRYCRACARLQQQRRQR
jgi:HNH endonuclease